MIQVSERKLLRDLAKKQMDMANSSRNKEIEKEWYRHNNYESGRPMIHVEMWTFGQEIIPQRLQCESDEGRMLEASMYGLMVNAELFKDDRVVPDFYPIRYNTWFKPFDIDVKKVKVDNGNGSDLGHEFVEAIHNIEEDIVTLKDSTFGYDKKGTEEQKKLAEDTFGDILPVKMNGHALCSSPMQDVVHLMSMENLFMCMYDKPDALSELMTRLSDDYVKYFKWLQEQNLILSTTGNQLLLQGSFCFNNYLPDGDGPKKMNEVWGYMDSQETVGVSPEMFGQFVYPYYKKISDHFGKLSYGCCEPVEALYEQYISKFKNLGKVSISPWCDEEKMGEYLKDESIIYLRKPSPNLIGVNKELDEDALRAHIRKTVEASKGCHVEFAQRDVYTIHNNVDKVRRYVEILREETT